MSAVFDAAHFSHMTGGDAALQREVVGLFRAQAEAWAGTLASERDPEALRVAVHTLKGSARGLGLWALAEACERAEADMGAGLAEVEAALTAGLAALDAHG